MKTQWMLILGSVFSVIIAIFAVINNRTVQVNYMFGEMNSPLIIVILLSFVIGLLVSASFSLVKLISLKSENKKLTKRLSALEMEYEEKQRQLALIDEPTVLLEQQPNNSEKNSVG